ncbi:hypothetical protein [Jhaorihella thermophila]|nr:hypothetical protein [Jhaorihella thermophila]
MPRQDPRHAVLFELLRQQSLSARITDRQRWRARIDRRDTAFARLKDQAERSWRRPPEPPRAG